MAENLPGFGLLHDNFAQNANVSWTRIITPRLFSSASIGLSRLSMTHVEENSYSKDLISDWRKPMSCGNFNVATGKCGGKGS